VIKRAKKAKIAFAATDQTQYDIYFMNGANISDMQLYLCDFFFYLYLQIKMGESSLPTHPRNVGFLLYLMAHNCISVNDGIKTAYRFNSTTYVEPTSQVIAQVAQMFTIKQLNYITTNTIVQESSPLVSAEHHDANIPADHRAFKSSHVGSSYCFYLTPAATDPPTTTQRLVDASGFQPLPENWFVKGCLAGYASVNDYPYGAVWTGLAPQPWVIQQHVTYFDSFTDIPYAAVTVADQSEESVAIILQAMQGMAEANAYIIPWLATITPDVFAQIINFVRAVYAPFLFIQTVDLSSYNYYGMVAAYPGPMYLPSILHEICITHSDWAAFRIDQSDRSEMVAFYHQPYSLPFTFDAVLTYETIMVSALASRRYMKLNAAPEYKQTKAMLPNFFFNVLVQDPLAGTNYFVVYSPYSLSYINAHNLQILATGMWWPILQYFDKSIMAYCTPIMANLLPEVTNLNVMIGYMCLDFSYQSDGCELDYYMHRCRISYLGLWSLLAGLLGPVADIGANLLGTIFKHGTGEKSPNEKSFANNLVDAGVSFVSQALAGSPGNGATQDMSQIHKERTTNIDTNQSGLIRQNKVEKLITVVKRKKM
jgi:hypothetical protein